VAISDGITPEQMAEIYKKLAEEPPALHPAMIPIFTPGEWKKTIPNFFPTHPIYPAPKDYEGAYTTTYTLPPDAKTDDALWQDWAKLLDEEKKRQEEARIFESFIKHAYTDAKADEAHAETPTTPERSDPVSDTQAAEPHYLDSLIESLNTELPKLDREFSPRQLRKWTVLRTNGEWRKNSITTNVDFFFHKARLGSKGNLLFQFTPINAPVESDLARTYEIMECPWGEALSELGGFDAAVIDAMGSDLAELIAAAKKGNEDKIKAAKKTDAQRAREMLESDDSWGAF
jgi:hypothetical protein